MILTLCFNFYLNYIYKHFTVPEHNTYGTNINLNSLFSCWSDTYRYDVHEFLWPFQTVQTPFLFFNPLRFAQYIWIKTTTCVNMITFPIFFVGQTIVKIQIYGGTRTGRTVMRLFRSWPFWISHYIRFGSNLRNG